MKALLAIWVRPAMALILYLAGGLAVTQDLAPFPASPAAALPLAVQIASCSTGFAEAADGDLRRLHRGWLLATDQGLLGVAADGTVVANLAPGHPCRAVATLARGPRPTPAEAFRLAYCTADGLFAVGSDGSHHQLATGERDDRGPLTALALDWDGNLFVAFGASREILRIAPDGCASHHAFIPDPSEACAGLLTMALEPVSGDLLVNDGVGLRRVTATGTLAEALAEGPGLPTHLAVHGRTLVMVDAERGEMQALDLENGERTTLLGATQRLAGPVAVNPQGCCLVSLEDGLATWKLPQAPRSSSRRGSRGTPDPGAARPPSRTDSSPSPRQAALAHFRTQQAEARAYKKRQRELRRSASRRSAPAVPPRRPAAARPRLSGMACLALLGVAALADPVLPAMRAEGLRWGPPAGPDLAAHLGRYQAQVEAQLAALGPICAAPELSGRNLVPCLPVYRASIQAQVRQLQAQVSRLFVDPPVLGAGTCRPGESKARAEERIELDQGDLLAAYDRLTADGASLWYQLTRDGYALQAVGTGLQLPSILAPLGGVEPGTLADLPAFATATVGHSLTSLGSVLQGSGTYAGWIANRAAILRPRWHRWAIRQTPRLLNCTAATPAFRGAPAPTPPLLASPAPALVDVLQWVEEGCRVAAQRGLALPVCAPETILDLRGQNATLHQSYQSLACSSAGTLLGFQEPCETESSPAGQDLSIAATYLEEYEAEMEDGAFPAFTAGAFLDAGAEGLLAAGDAARQTGNATGAAIFYAASNTLFMAGNGLYSSGYEFYRLAAVGRAWQTLLTLDSNAVARARLDQAYARDQAARGSSSGSGGAAAPEPEPKPEPEPEPGPMVGPLGGGGARGGGRGVDEAVAPAASPAARARPGLLWDLLGWFRPRPAFPADPPRMEREL